MDDASKIVCEARAASEQKVLVAFFKAREMTTKLISLETCSLSSWLHSGLKEAGLFAISIEAR